MTVGTGFAMASSTVSPRLTASDGSAADTAGDGFSAQTFHVTYSLRRPGLVVPVFQGLVACGGLRQLARSFHASPQTIHVAELAQTVVRDRHEDTPAMRAGFTDHRLDPSEILKQQRFVTHARLPDAHSLSRAHQSSAHN